MSDNKIEKEVRFAVVMYGGGSLAIYINGIAQELLKMVRSTAKNRKKKVRFGGTELVYRQLALLLSDEQLLKTIAELDKPEKIELALDSLVKPEDETAPQNTRSLFEKHLKEPSVRFVIDVITGSSAGGINGVFLAKALVNNQQIERLKKLWLDEGDFNKLLNDKYSVADIPLNRPTEPASLLNSRRMYLKLLAALDEMDEPAVLNVDGDEPRSPNVEELDLFVTVTDFAGVPVPIRLFDRVVNERRHRQFFHFRYDKNAENHFKRQYNPFLAFAARSTSAFPLAFEPIRLSDIDSVIDSRFSEAYGGGKSDSSLWVEFFNNFKLPKEQNPTADDEKAVKEANCARYFVDGGALDNKPFSFAIETLLKRQSNVPVDRKLIYIEPSPDALSGKADAPKKPDAVENLFGQASGLPRYETIREDLQQLLERNRFVERINRLIRNSERDVYKLLNDRQAEDLIKNLPTTGERGDYGEAWEKRGLNEIIAYKGAAFLPYYRLRLIAATDDVARSITRFYGFDEDSDYFLAIRSIVRYWREDTFKENLTEAEKIEEKAKTVNYFLRHYDLNYRFRRHRFVKRKAEELYTFGDDIRDQLNFRSIKIKQTRAIKTKETGDVPKQTENKLRLCEGDLINGKFPSEIIWEKCVRNNEKNATERIARKQQIADNIAQMRRILEYCQQHLNQGFQELNNNLKRLAAFRLNSEPAPPGGDGQPLADNLLKKLAAINLTTGDLEYILGEEKSGKKIIKSAFDEDIGCQRAKSFLKSGKNKSRNIYENLQEAGAALDQYLEAEFFKPSREKISALLGKSSDDKQNQSETEKKLIAKHLRHFKEEKFDEELLRAVLAFLRHYYDKFDDYDQISFPIFYQTPVGEADTVEIVRISPHDAPSLINELDENEKRRKLAGNALYGFGAFLDVRWRQNDIAWGRLDGAERIITALLPTGEKYDFLRSVLIKKAHEAIFEEEFVCQNRDALNEQVVAALLNAKAYGGENNFEQTIEKITGKLIDSSVLKNNLGDVFKNCLKDSAGVYTAVQKGYQIDRSLEPREALRMASRATQVAGKILEQIAEKNARAGSRLAWIARLGAVFWSLIEVAAPHTLLNLLFRYWLKLLYVFEAFLIIGGTLLSKEVQNFGIIVFLTTLAAHLTTLYLNDLMRGRDAWKKTIAAVLLIAGVIFAVLGVFLFLALFFVEGFWTAVSDFRSGLNDLPERYRILPGVLLGALILLALISGGIRNYFTERRFGKDSTQ